MSRAVGYERWDDLIFYTMSAEAAYRHTFHDGPLRGLRLFIGALHLRRLFATRLNPPYATFAETDKLTKLYGGIGYSF
ncbi:MAG: hypothetical protein AABY65_05380 [Nitrospirota bacterium]